MNENTKTKPTYLRPFRRFCMTIGELPSSYIETMTYYEMLLWFTKYLSETVIPTINNNAKALEEVQIGLVELKQYVDDPIEQDILNQLLVDNNDNKIDEELMMKLVHTKYNSFDKSKDKGKKRQN